MPTQFTKKLFKEKLKNTHACECPFCERERKPAGLYKDGNPFYICPADYNNHGNAVVWRTDNNGELIFIE